MPTGLATVHLQQAVNWITVRSGSIFSYETAFHVTLAPLATPQPCQLQAHNPHLVHRYNRALEIKLQDAQMLDKLQLVSCSAPQCGWTDKLDAQYNCLHTQQ